jgi:hypothetical protein
MKGSIKVVHRATMFLDHLVKIHRDGVADPVEDDDVYLNPPQIIGRSVVHDVLD